MEDRTHDGPARAGRRLYVDAMNVIGSRPDGWWRDRDAAVRRLVAELCEHLTHRGPETIVVIDGPPVGGLPAGPHGPVRLVYAPRAGPDAADDRIVELVGADPAPTVVATADRALRERVTALGADTIGPRELRRRLAIGR